MRRAAVLPAARVREEGVMRSVAPKASPLGLAYDVSTRVPTLAYSQDFGRLATKWVRAIPSGPVVVAVGLATPLFVDHVTATPPLALPNRSFTIALIESW